jgi:DNA-binding NarL/FixJ family response regulator
MIRLLLADDHRVFRQGLARLLRDEEDFEVIAQAGSYGDVLAAARSHKVDVAVLDLSMPGRDGLELIGHLKEMQPGIKILVITMQSGDFTAVRALRAGADGFMTKESAAEDVVSAIRQIVRGARYVCPAVAERLALGMAGTPTTKKAHECLSDREFKIFEMLVAGKRGSEIANELSLSEKTVSTHKTHVLRKLELQTSSDLVRYAIRHQLVAE